jgi:hypothetical protein
LYGRAVRFRLSERALMTAIPKGALVVDGKSGKVGFFQQEVLGIAWLRPVGGGREWETAPQSLELVKEDESA